MYRVDRDNGHACGTLCKGFTSKRAAEQYGREWKRGVVAIETTPKGRR